MKHVLVAVDDSPGASSVLEAGIDMARRTGATVRLLRVVGVPPDLAPSEWASSPTQVVDGFIATAKRDLRELARLVPEGMLEAVTAQVGIAQADQDPQRGCGVTNARVMLRRGTGRE